MSDRYPLPIPESTPVSECSFGSLVAARRQGLGITRDVLAERVGVAGPTISRVELGQRSPSVELFVALVRELRLDAAAAVDGMWAQTTARRQRTGCET